MGGKRIRGLEVRWGASPLAEGSPVKVYQMEEFEEEVTVLRGECQKKARRAAPEVAKSLNLQKESSEHFK